MAFRPAPISGKGFIGRDHGDGLFEDGAEGARDAGAGARRADHPRSRHPTAALHSMSGHLEGDQMAGVPSPVDIGGSTVEPPNSADQQLVPSSKQPRVNGRKFTGRPWSPFEGGQFDVIHIALPVVICPLSARNWPPDVARSMHQMPSGLMSFENCFL